MSEEYGKLLLSKALLLLSFQGQSGVVFFPVTVLECYRMGIGNLSFSYPCAMAPPLPLCPHLSVIRDGHSILA